MRRHQCPTQQEKQQRHKDGLPILCVKITIIDGTLLTDWSECFDMLID
jgi:hypothetical protein